MNVIRQQDRVLLGGLAVALIVVAAKPIRYLLDLARDVERSSGLALIPALLILTVVFLFHQQGKRQEVRARAAAAEADARQAGTRAAEMERLVTLLRPRQRPTRLRSWTQRHLRLMETGTKRRRHIGRFSNSIRNCLESTIAWGESSFLSRPQ